MTESAQHFRIVIVGGGFAGIGMAIKLLEDGERDFVVLERERDVGGVWRDNTYPGCACDVHSRVYSFSFALNPEWSRAFSPSGEIWRYLRDTADRFGVTPHVRFEHDLLAAAWDDDARLWRVATSKGSFTCDALVSAVGALCNPSIPKIPGLDRFAGKVMHSARWDHAHDLAGRRVAVIGTGASAVQFIPEIQPKVGSLTVFQRTPAWIVPRGDRPVPEARRRFYARHPGVHRATRNAIFLLRELTVIPFLRPRYMRHLQKLAERHLARQVRDPVLRKKLTPSYTMGCKRVLVSDDYLRSLTKENVEVVTTAIAEVRERSIVTHDGAEHEADTIILGTGFVVTDIAIGKLVRGADGRTLDEAWGGSMKAHLGTTVAGYPNLFMLLGPNTGLGHNSVVTMIEAQIEHVTGALRWMKERGVAAIEPRCEAQASYVAGIDRRLAGTVWNTGGCQSWYLDATGRNSTIWPGSTLAFWRRVARFRPEEYVAHAARSARRAPSPSRSNDSPAPNGAAA